MFGNNEAIPARSGVPPNGLALSGATVITLCPLPRARVPQRLRAGQVDCGVRLERLGSTALPRVLASWKRLSIEGQTEEPRNPEIDRHHCGNDDPAAVSDNR